MKTASVYARIDENLKTQQKQLDRKLEAGYQSAQRGQGRPAAEVFHDLEKAFGF